MAVELLRQLLQSSAAAPSDPHAVTSEFLLQSLRQLSSAEAVGLMPWAEVASAPSHGASASGIQRVLFHTLQTGLGNPPSETPCSVRSRQNALACGTVESTKCCTIQL